MRDKIFRFLELTNFDATVKGMIETLGEQFKMSFGEGANDPKIDKAVNLVKSTLYANVDALKNEITPIYSNHFSESELDHIISFYESDAGKKLTQIGGNLMLEVGRVADSWRDKLLHSLDKDLAQILS